MGFIFKLIKGTLKLSVFLFVGVMLLMLTQEYLLPNADDSVFAVLFLLVVLISIILVIKPSLLLRTSSPKSADKDEASAPIENLQEAVTADVKQALPADKPVAKVKTAAGQASKKKVPAQIDNKESNELAETPDFQPLLKKFEREEKFVLMLGLLALYGDGKFSESEISQFREIMKKIKFNPSTLTHRDPSDVELCLDEKVAWAINLIQSDFVNTDAFSDDDIIELFKAFTLSIETDIESEFKDVKSRKEQVDQIQQALKDIAKADGEISKREKELLSAFDKTSGFTGFSIFKRIFNESFK